MEGFRLLMTAYWICPTLTMIKLYRKCESRAYRYLPMKSYVLESDVP